MPCKFFLAGQFLFLYDFIISSCCKQVDNGVYQCKCGKGEKRRNCQQVIVGKPHHLKHTTYYWKCEDNMNSGGNKRQEEKRQNLTAECGNFISSRTICGSKALNSGIIC